MALSIVKKANQNQNPGGSSQTWAYTHTNGTDDAVILVMYMSNSVSYSSATYRGTAMTLVRTSNFSAQSQRYAVFELLNPPTSGTNQFVVNFSANQWSSTSMFAMSVHGTDGIGNHDSNDLGATPNSKTLVVSNGSAIFASGVSSNAFTGIDIDGSARTLEYQHNTNSQVAGAISSIPLSAGTIDVVTKVTYNNVTNQRFEILEKSTPPPTSNGNFLQFF